jgi:tRNA (guanine-N7-)-methyltransferase
VGHPLLLGQPCNFLGIEIRAPLVERANKWAAKLGCQHRVHYLYANATVSLATLLGTYPGPLVRVAVQFPDPHFKRRHHKRRIIQPAVVDCLKKLMPPGGEEGASATAGEGWMS